MLPTNITALKIPTYAKFSGHSSEVFTASS